MLQNQQYSLAMFYPNFSTINLTTNESTSSYESLQAQYRFMRPELDWGDFAWMREQWSGPLFIKGVLEADDAGRCVLAGNVGLKNREETGRIGERETAEIGYWTAVAARGRGIAPAAVRAVTDWVFDAFAGASLRQIMLVHDVGNPASRRVPEKAVYPFRELSPANPPHWFTDGHIHMRLGG